MDLTDYHYDENSTLTLQQKHQLLLAMGIIGILDVISCLVALGVVLIFRLYRYFIHRLAMYQVIVAFFFGSTNIFQLIVNYNYNSNLHSLCVAIGFLSEYSLWVKLCFTLCLTFHLLLFSVCHVNLKRLEVAHIVLSIVFPLLFVWIPFMNNLYGQAGAWCFIRNWNNDDAINKTKIGETEQYVLLYGPSITSLSISVVIVIVIVSVLTYRACKASNENTPLIGDHKKALKEVVPLMVYPVLSFIMYMLALVNRLYGTLYSNIDFAGFMLGAVSIPSLSFFAGITLIVHVVILKCNKQKPHNPLNNTDRANTKNVINNFFTSDLPSRSTAATFWEAPPESYIDDLYSSD
jgi:hypothetical protein